MAKSGGVTNNARKTIAEDLLVVRGGVVTIYALPVNYAGMPSPSSATTQRLECGMYPVECGGKSDGPGFSNGRGTLK